jgi:hypothetical protein
MKIVIEQINKTIKQYTLSLEMVDTANIRLVATDNLINSTTTVVVNFTDLYRAIHAISTENQNK